MPTPSLSQSAQAVASGERTAAEVLETCIARIEATEARVNAFTGNAVFEAPARTAAGHARRIRAAIAERMSLDVPVIVKSAEDIAGACAENALLGKATDHARLLAAFAGREEDLRALETLAPLVKPPERFLVGKHGAYLWCAHGILESGAASALLGKVGRAATTRNWATVTKISALLQDHG
jgi:uncharacterized protein (DUF1697 family)